MFIRLPNLLLLLTLILGLSACNETTTPPQQQFTLSVTVNGNGTVTSSPAGLSCRAGDACSTVLSAGTTVGLSATPDSGAEFSTWSGDCSGSSCSLTMNGNRSVTATFGALTVPDPGPNPSPNPDPDPTPTPGEGDTDLAVSVSNSSDDAEQFLDDVNESFPAGSVVVDSSDLELGYDAGFKSRQLVGLRFTGISVDSAAVSEAFIAFTPDKSSSSSVTLTIRAEASVSPPTFTETSNNISSRTLTTAAVSWSPGAWSAGEVSAATTTPDLKPLFDELLSLGWTSGEVVFVISGANTNLRPAVSFDGQAAGAPKLLINLEGEKEPDPESTFALTVTKDGDGAVTSDPAGIDCGEDCSEGFDENTSVTLSAVAAEGSVFAGWGGACSGTDACSVVMSEAKAVSATFNAVTPPPTFSLSVTKEGTGTGTVTSSPEGIDCGEDCEESFTKGTSVTLTAEAAKGSMFAGFTGCTEAGGTPANTCTVTVDQARSITATFTSAGGQAPTVSDVSDRNIGLAGGQVNFTVSDPEGEIRRVTASSSDESVVVISEGDITCTDGNCTLDIDPLTLGEATITLTVTDVDNLSASDTFVVTVTYDRTVTTEADSGVGSLRQTVLEADSGDTIGFDDAVSNITLTSGEIVLDKNLTIIGAVTVDGNANSRIFNVATGATVVLEDLILTNGSVEGADSEGYGGAIFNNGTLTLQGATTISDNSAEVRGGGIYNLNGALTLTDNASVSGNKAHPEGWVVGGLNPDFSGAPTTDFRGGGIYSESGQLTLGESVSISSNASRSGGGIYNENGTLTLSENSVVESNQANNAGGVFNRDGNVVMEGNAKISNNVVSVIYPRVGTGGGVISSGTFTMRDDTSVVGNFSGAKGEGELYGEGTIGGIDNTGTLILEGNATVSGNSSNSVGGGLYNSGTIILRNNATVSNNTAYEGGGIASGGEIVLQDAATVTGNVATSRGGGILSYGGGSPSLILEGTASISDNSAELGAGIHVTNGSITLQDDATVNTNAATAEGGGIYIYDAALVDLTGADYDQTGDDDNIFNNTPDQVHIRPTE